MILLSAPCGCGGNTHSDVVTSAGGSSSGSGGGATTGKGGTSVGGGTTVSGGTTGSAGTGGEQSSSGGASEGGVAGSTPDLVHCNGVYEGPHGGPRVDGPAPITQRCSSISDEVILARYDDRTAKVPTGLYWQAEAFEVWESPCSNSLADTVARSSSKDFGPLVGQFTTPWFFEAVYCKDNFRRLYRIMRCDYFDGEKLGGGADAKELAFLVSLLWWQKNTNISGNVLLGYSTTIGDATDRIELCSLSTVYGDFGLCDEITLESTTHRIMVGGMVTLGERTVVRTIKGKCRSG